MQQIVNRTTHNLPKKYTLLLKLFSETKYRPFHVVFFNFWLGLVSKRTEGIKSSKVAKFERVLFGEWWRYCAAKSPNFTDVCLVGGKFVSPTI